MTTAPRTIDSRTVSTSGELIEAVHAFRGLFRDDELFGAYVVEQVEETLSDGSTVTSIRIRLAGAAL